MTTDMKDYGDGSDGDAVWTGDVTLDRPMNFRTLTIKGECRLTSRGHRVNINGPLDLSECTGWTSGEHDILAECRTAGRPAGPTGL